MSPRAMGCAPGSPNLGVLPRIVASIQTSLSMELEVSCMCYVLRIIGGLRFML